MRAELIRHPDSPAGPVRGIAVTVRRVGGRLLLAFEAVGDIGALTLPPPREGRADELWRGTCFEAFVADGGGYAEYNFAPSSQWAAYRFTGYREGMDDADVDDPDIRVAIGPERLDLAAQIAAAGEGARLALSAVLAHAHGGKSYWALAHPPGAPDFHHPSAFTLILPSEAE